MRRSLDQSGHDLLSDWFLAQGGRGAQPGGGSRSRNVLVTAAAVSLLGDLYGDRFQTLVPPEHPSGSATGAAACKTGLASAAKTSGPTAAWCCLNGPMP